MHTQWLGVCGGGYGMVMSMTSIARGWAARPTPGARGAVVDLGGADEQDARRMPLGLTRILRSSPSASSLHVDASIVRDIPGTRKGALE